jgi:germination protein M
LNKNDTNTEIIPEAEITDEQMRQTQVVLFFKKENELFPGTSNIDAKKLLSNPYQQVIELLINGPKDSKLEATIPKATKVLDLQKNGDILIIDFSKEFLQNDEDVNKYSISTQSILYTVTQFTEINGIEIKIEGKQNSEIIYKTNEKN